MTHVTHKAHWWFPSKAHILTPWYLWQQTSTFLIPSYLMHSSSQNYLPLPTLENKTIFQFSSLLLNSVIIFSHVRCQEQLRMASGSYSPLRSSCSMSMAISTTQIPLIFHYLRLHTTDQQWPKWHHLLRHWNRESKQGLQHLPRWHSFELLVWPR